MRKAFTLFYASLLSFTVFSQNTALNFDGVDDYVAIPEKAGVLTGFGFTFETWVKPTGSLTDHAPILRKSDEFAGLNVLLIPGDPMFGQPDMLQVDISTVSNYTSVVYELASSWTNQWHHIAVTYNGSRVRLFVDGVLNPGCEASVTGMLPLTGAPVYLGFYSPGWPVYFNGTYDEVRFWNTPLTQAQIQAGMNTEIAPGTANLTAYYKFNQGTINGNNVAVTTAIDMVAAPNNGTLYNFAKTGTTSNFTVGYGSLVTLPVKESSFTAIKNNGGVRLAWTALPSAAISLFEIERSSNGTSFKKIGAVAGPASATEATYHYTDAQPLSVNYYRLKLVDANGAVMYSRTLAIKTTGNGVALQSYPNPAQSTLQVQVTAPAGTLQLRVKDLTGRTLKATRLTSNGTTLNTALDISGLSKGTYVLSAGEQSIFFIKQ